MGGGGGCGGGEKCHLVVLSCVSLKVLDFPDTFAPLDSCTSADPRQSFDLPTGTHECWPLNFHMSAGP